MGKIDIVLGDWSDDGHGKYEKITISINITKEQMQDAYLASNKKFGFDFAELCQEYEDYTMDDDFYNLLVRENYPDVFDLFNLNEYSRNLDKDQFLDLLMWWVEQSYPEFKWKKVKGIPTFNGFWDDKLNINLAYGLFGN